MSGDLRVYSCHVLSGIRAALTATRYESGNVMLKLSTPARQKGGRRLQSPGNEHREGTEPQARWLVGAHRHPTFTAFRTLPLEPVGEKPAPVVLTWRRRFIAWTANRGPGRIRSSHDFRGERFLARLRLLIAAKRR